MVLGFIGGDGGMWQTLLSFGMLMLFFLLFPRIMLFQITYKIRSALEEIKANADAAQELFLENVAGSATEGLEQTMEPMKNMVVSPPVGLDPAGMVDKLEHVLDTSEDKMKQFVRSFNPDATDDELANSSMAFKGVYGSHQVFVVMRHFKKMIEETSNYQLGGMIQMVLPLYKELSQSQKDATEAFVNEVPIGDTVGPIIAAKLIEDEEANEEVAEDVIVSEQSLDEETEFLVMKSKGPGARLGKYGDAVESVLEDNDVEKILTVDAGMRFEGEETGTIVDGTGVLMGGPGVEKSKIEDVATEHDVPLEGFVIKQSGPQASKPMHHKIWDAHEDAVSMVKDEIRNVDGTVLVVGVGNTCGAGNSRGSLTGIKNKLKPYWKEQKEESASYFGLMKAFPMGGGDALEAESSFELFQKIVR